MGVMGVEQSTMKSQGAVESQVLVFPLQLMDLMRRGTSKVVGAEGNKGANPHASAKVPVESPPA